MSYINVFSGRKEQELIFLDKIYLTNDNSVYISPNKWTIGYLDEKGNEQISHHNRKPEWIRMFILLIENNGKYVTSDEIYYRVVKKQKKYDEYDDEEKNDELDNDDIDFKVDSICKEIYKQKFYKAARNRNFKFYKSGLGGTDRIGYMIELPPQSDNLFEVYGGADEPLQHILTETIVPDSKSIIHRDIFVNKILEDIEIGHKAINITGFGGIGKTSVSQIIYKHYVSESEDNIVFKHVGYVSYKGNLKTSILSSMPYLYSDLDEKKRWIRISTRLKNSKEKTLLIIDNVDRDVRLHQDPLNEEEADMFRDISGWPNLTVILTSRLEEVPGFISFQIDTLGDDSNPDPCVDLFCLYNNVFIDEKETIKKLVKLCNYHTYAIELVAKSTKYINSLEKYCEKFKKLKFESSNQNIRVNYKKNKRDRFNNTTAATQIKCVFDMGSRNDYDIKKLEKFAALPDMEQLTEEDLKNWFILEPNDLSGLIEEGWINCYKGQYYIHPLVKEAILLGSVEKKLPEDAAGEILKTILDNSFWTDSESYFELSRKVRIAESIIESIQINDKNKNARLALCIADKARKISNRAVALRLYEESESLYKKIEKNLSEEDLPYYWKAKYYRGYVLSYTNSKFSEAEKYLKQALKLSKKINDINPTRKSLEHLATSWDHYGYVLSNSERDDEAEKCLRMGLNIREELEKNFPNEYRQMVAWSADNLGFLLSFDDGKRVEGEELLKQALSIRKSLAKGKASSEVAWTSSNLACLYLLSEEKYDEAKELIEDALFEYQELEIIAPKAHYASMAYICNNYGMLYLKGFNEKKEAFEQFLKSYKMYKELEYNYPDSYFQEIAMVRNNMANLCQLNFEGNQDLAELYYQEAIELIESKIDIDNLLSKDLDLISLLLSIKYNYWIYLLKDTAKKNERKRVERFIDNILESDILYEKILIKSEFRDYKEKKSDNDLVFFVQGGARKKKVRIIGKELKRIK